MGERYTYSYGYTSLESANIALEELLAAGQVSRGEFPRVERYFARLKAATPVGLARVFNYQITLEGN